MRKQYVELTLKALSLLVVLLALAHQQSQPVEPGHCVSHRSVMIR